MHFCNVPHTLGQINQIFIRLELDDLRPYLGKQNAMAICTSLISGFRVLRGFAYMKIAMVFSSIVFLQINSYAIGAPETRFVSSFDDARAHDPVEAKGAAAPGEAQGYSYKLKQNPGKSCADGPAITTPSGQSACGGQSELFSKFQKMYPGKMGGDDHDAWNFNLKDQSYTASLNAEGQLQVTKMVDGSLKFWTWDANADKFTEKSPTAKVAQATAAVAAAPAEASVPSRNVASVPSAESPSIDYGMASGGLSNPLLDTMSGVQNPANNMWGHSPSAQEQRAAVEAYAYSPQAKSYAEALAAAYNPKSPPSPLLQHYMNPKNTGSGNGLLSKSGQ